MKIKVAKLQEYLKQNKLTKEEFAKKLGVHVNEVLKMLNGEAVGINTARKFINTLTSDEAQKLIDWDAIGVKNPLGEKAK